MLIHNTKLPYRENQSVLIRERVRNICKVFIMFQNRMQKKKNR